MIRGVLFVCVGNLCRSPMAAGVLGHAMPGMKVASAGIHAQTGAAADPSAIAIMRERGIDIETHRAQPLTRALCAAHDVIFVMDEPLKNHVLFRYPQLRGRVRKLSERCIADPYQQSYAAFVDCYTHVAEAVGVWRPRLHALARVSARGAS
ncbi:low molecular weight protein-tyrosine-phosphatase [Dyella mobilis]|uniref:protein-tyrosine-phosphatase n=1 Tax=Dyella mobilis TaxID=1849582 RepID=A0ABS2KG37_9GAMM|nr:low molecular weight protein-tyrosine-phosphatase [Dyella mobilis]MBM7129835.1 low molecular weight phosphotyrosine protein phosphatase [Dyella mobilis]GLQ97901.1 protein-tyrosine-phosphatase [Dyella mobilis]